MTVRARPFDPRIEIPRDQFELDVQEVKPISSGQLPKVDLHLPTGLKPGFLYEVIYEAETPLIHGVCFAAVRDLISAFKFGERTKNTLLAENRPIIKRAHSFVHSQSGRFLREFLYSGFNEDEKTRKVFDGLIPNVAGGGLGSFNHRFAQPTMYNTQHQFNDFCSDRFPFAYEDQSDPYSKSVDGIMRRSVNSKTAPFVIHTQSAADYWTRSGSLPHTTADGKRDARVPKNARFYSFGGTQQGPAFWSLGRGSGQQLENPGDYLPQLRALLLALDRWVEDGTPPPASQYPRIDEGTLVEFQASKTGFPTISGVHYPNAIRAPSFLDFGPRWRDKRIMDIQPPRMEGTYHVLVPASDRDGNDRGCLLPPEVAVPLATFTGWNIQRKPAGIEGQLVGMSGSYFPFALTEVERKKKGDPRTSIESRYGSLDNYLAKFRAYCVAMSEKGYLLQEDIDRIINRQQKIAPQAGLKSVLSNM